MMLSEEIWSRLTTSQSIKLSEKQGKIRGIKESFEFVYEFEENPNFDSTNIEYIKKRLQVVDLILEILLGEE